MVDSVDSAFNVYRDQLSARSHGLALWNPKPPKEICNNVSIGDVGYLDGGILLGNPEPYDPLDGGPFTNTIEAQFDEAMIPNMEGVTYKFQNHGALLCLPTGVAA
ncbi:hypothetical protein BGY98DRAFT_1179677 [Russula aff. rugulosa BPL654]|nr:hypothetical protein BGY98DRAFT_1179677 [Russula aff. rugulosa BPL654]